MDQKEGHHHSLPRPVLGQQPTSILKNSIVTTTNGQSNLDTRTLLLNHHPFNTSYKLFDVLESKYFWTTFAALFITAIGNLVLSIWIVKALQLGQDGGLGSGQIHFLKNGMDIRTEATFDELTVSSIRATSNPSPLLIESKNRQSIIITSVGGRSIITFGDNKMEIQTPKFIVLNSGEKETLFEVTPEGMSLSGSSSVGGQSSIRGQSSVGGQNSRSHSIGGYNILESISTDSITGTTIHDLRVESRTESINVKGQSINIDSKAGNVRTVSLHDVTFDSNHLRIDSKRTSFKGLRMSERKNGAKKTDNDALSLQDGRLFTASSSSSSNE